MDSTAREIMSTEVLTIRSDTTVEEALKVLVNNKVTGLPVVDAQGKMVGILSEYDILLQVASKPKVKAQIFKETVQFSREVKAIDQETPLKTIVELFTGTKFRRLPVVDQNQKLVGIITRRDLMRLFYYRARLG